MRARVLVVEDDDVARGLLIEVLRRDGHEVLGLATGEEAVRRAPAFRPHVVVTDVQLGGIDGLELMKRVEAIDPSVQTIVVTAFGSLSVAVEAIQSGAFDYLSKPFPMEDICRTVRRALEARTPVSEGMGDARGTAQEIVGRSPAMTHVFRTIARVGPLKVSVLIHGETGTGKELVARAIHDAGGRAAGPYVAISCPSLPESLLEAELFGHVRGSFTGATVDRPGLFEAADGGTLLLDEIGDMPLAVQTKLLRVLESSELRRVGSTAIRRVDVRVLAATNRNLVRAVAEGGFREDLLYRLNAVTLEIPPLRERREDIPLLAEYFLRRHAEAGGSGQRVLADGVLESFLAYPWPGNVRELSHVIERAIALAGGMRIETEDLPANICEGARQPAEVAASSPRTLEEVERAHILSVLKSAGGARGNAASILGIDRKTLYRKLRRYGLAEEEDAAAS